MTPSKLIKLIDIITILKESKDIAKIEIKYVDSDWTIPLELDDKRINRIIDDAKVEQIRLIIDM